MFSSLKHSLFTKTKIIIYSVLFSIAIVFGSFHYADAYCTFMGMYCFGGRITETKVCCNGLKIKVGQPRDGTFIFTSQSKLYMFYMLVVNEWVKGDAWPGGVCIIPNTWPPCSEEESVDGTIRQIGTSLDTGFSGGGGGFGGGGASGGF